MKREDLWELLGDVPAEMIEEASAAPTGKRCCGCGGCCRWRLPWCC